VRGWLLVAALAAASLGWAEERVSLVSTRLAVAGEVQRELVLTVDDLRALAERHGGLARCADETKLPPQFRGYAGARLVDLLAEADIRRDAPHALRRSYVVATASDGYEVVFSWGELFNTPVGKDVIVAIEREGAPLRDGEGRFALISFADERLGPRHVKWLSRIEVRRLSEPPR
jgi:DMSO/TMAO reductase YedYZ molybdopterin-dependent catalytic subunit